MERDRKRGFIIQQSNALFSECVGGNARDYVGTIKSNVDVMANRPSWRQPPAYFFTRN